MITTSLKYIKIEEKEHEKTQVDASPGDTPSPQAQVNTTSWNPSRGRKKTPLKKNKLTYLLKGSIVIWRHNNLRPTTNLIAKKQELKKWKYKQKKEN